MCKLVVLHSASSHAHRNDDCATSECGALLLCYDIFVVHLLSWWWNVGWLLRINWKWVQLLGIYLLAVCWLVLSIIMWCHMVEWPIIHAHGYKCLVLALISSWIILMVRQERSGHRFLLFLFNIEHWIIKLLYKYILSLFLSCPTMPVHLPQPWGGQLLQ